VALGDVFLATWARDAAAHSDIAARGPFLLSAFLPHFLGVALVLAAGVAAWRAGGRYWSVIAAAVLGVLLCAAALYAEPTGFLFRVRNALPLGDLLGTRLVVDALCAVAGFVVVRRATALPPLAA